MGLTDRGEIWHLIHDLADSFCYDGATNNDVYLAVSAAFRLSQKNSFLHSPQETTYIVRFVLRNVQHRLPHFGIQQCKNLFNTVVPTLSKN